MAETPAWPSGMPTTAEPLSSSDPQDTCDPTAKPGATALTDLLTRTYGTTRYGISRDCSIGGRSEHKEGRAVDWMLDSYDSVERQTGDEFASWLLSTDPWGNEYAGMRRLGIMYMIWNRQSIYSWAVDEGWRAYTGSSPHTDHIHFSMTWPGARCQTSFWEATGCTGVVDEPGSDDSETTTSTGDGGFEGDGFDDILWYGPGSRSDSLWFGERNGFDTSVGTRVNGTYEPLSGDFDGDGFDDILWYGPGSGGDHLWEGTARRGQFRDLDVRVHGTYRPITGDFDSDGHDDVFWYGVGSRGDSIWYGTDDGWSIDNSPSAGANYRPIAGDFDGNGHDDVMWYAPGSASDFVWFATGSGNFRSQRVTVNGTYEPLAGDFDGNGVDDIFWYRPGSAKDFWWKGSGSGDFTSTSRYQIQGDYRAVAGDFDDNGVDDIFWYGVGSRSDWIYYGRSGGFDPVSTQIGGDYQPIATG